MLVVNFFVKEPSLAKYRDENQKRLLNFKNYGLETIPRSKTKFADALATLILKMGQVEEDVIQISLEVKQEPIAVSKTEKADWIQEIRRKGTLNLKILGKSKLSYY